MKPFGKFKKMILNIGGIVTDTEDHKGKPWQGKEGRLLETTLANLGIDLFEDCLNIPAIACYPGDSKLNLPYQTYIFQ